MKPKSEIDLRSAKNIISESLSVPTEIDVGKRQLVDSLAERVHATADALFTLC
jgi:hypothetical protein